MTGSPVGRRDTSAVDASARNPRGVALRAAAVGLAAGMRAMAPAAMLALAHDDAAPTAPWTRWPVLRSAWGRRVLVALSAGELVADKLPGIPSRLQPPALIGRVASGAIAAAALGSESGGRRHTLWAAVVGASAALAGSVLCARGRAWVVSRAGLPDPVVAVVEDAACVGLLAAVARNRPLR